MEFHVVDPKTHSYEEWLHRVESFLESYEDVEVREGEVYSTSHDIAELWHDNRCRYVWSNALSLETVLLMNLQRQLKL